jgi:hypothetical protein
VKVEHQSPEVSYLSEVLARLWPSAPVVFTRGSARLPETSARALVVLPGRSSPRLLVPRRARAAAAAIAGYQTAGPEQQRLKTRLAAAGARLGALALAPTVVSIGRDRGTPGIDAQLARLLETPVQVSIHLGPPRAVRKPVIQVIDERTNQTVAFAKIGVTQVSERLVAREGAVLQQLHASRLRTVQVPDVLFRGRCNDLEVLLLSPLRPDRSSVSTDLLHRAVAEIARLRGVTSGTFTSQPYLAGLRSRVDRLRPSAERRTLHRAVEQLSRRAADVSLRYGSWHGDLTPWNVAAAGDRALVWDWEHFQSGVPLGFDAVHHHVYRDVRSGKDPADALLEARREAPAMLGGFQPGEAASTLAASLYTVDIATRYLEDDEPAGVTRLGAVSSWLSPVLSSASESLVVPG